jgi:predicted CoA-binding protein
MRPRAGPTRFGSGEVRMMTVAVVANDFLAQRRIALVGVSRDPRDMSRRLFAELRGRGYDVVPVHPTLDAVDGAPCARRLQDVSPPVDGALLMTAPAVTDRVVRDCVEARVPRVWMHRGAGQGAVSAAAVAYCRDHGVAVVAGACPFMFLPRAGFVHRTHGFISRLLGQHPAQRAA